MTILNISRCPHCDKIIDFNVNATYSWVKEEVKAPNIFKCPKCGELISTGESEWIHKSASERRAYVFKKIIITVITAVLVGFALTMLTGVLLLQEYWGIKFNIYVFVGLYIIFGGGIAVTNYLSYKKEIENSINRTQSERNIQDLET